MDNPEIILNLWFVADDMGVIYSLRARAYLGYGTDEQKLAFLQSFALTDYLIAKPFPVPARYHYGKMPVCLKPVYDSLPNKAELFADAIKALHNDLPSQTPFDIPASPLVCITPLFGDDYSNIKPLFSGEERLG